MERQEILDGIKKCLMECIRVEEADIRPEVRLIDDLGADSLDLIDFIFSMERHFKISIRQGGIEKMAREGLGEAEFAENNKLREKGVARLREILSEVPPDEITEGMHTTRIPYLFRIETVIKMVERSLAEKAAGVEGSQPEGSQPEGSQPEGIQPEGSQPEGTP